MERVFHVLLEYVGMELEVKEDVKILVGVVRRCGNASWRGQKR